MNKKCINKNVENYDMMIMKLKAEKYCIENFGEPVAYSKKKGDVYKDYYRYSIKVNGKQKAFCAVTLEGLYDKVWHFFNTTNQTLKDVYDAFIDESTNIPRKDGQTIRDYKGTWSRKLCYCPFVDKPIKDITSADVFDYFASITANGLLKKKAFQKIHTLLNLIFDKGIRLGLCSDNVSRNISNRNFVFDLQKKKTTYSDEEAKILLSYLGSIEQDVFTLAIRFAFCSGLRISELRALTWDDVDFDKRTFTISRMVKDSVNKDSGKFFTEDCPFTKSRLESGCRVISMSDTAFAILSKLYEINGSCHYVFQGKHKAKLSVSGDTVNMHLKGYCEIVGVTYYTFHNIRAFVITKMYYDNVPESTISLIAGHSSIFMTREYLAPTALVDDKYVASLDFEASL